MKKALLLLNILFCSFALATVSCASNTPKQNKAVGTVVGGGAGAAIGAYSNQASATTPMIGIGAIVGALIGSVYSTPMDAGDKKKAYEAIASGKPATWQNPKSKITYTITPATRYVSIHHNPNCREFIATQTMEDDSTRKIHRAACRDVNGAWEEV